MGRIIAASINLSKIDKTRIKKGENGAQYYDISIVVNDQFNKFGQDVGIKEGRTKEEREAKKLKDVYIGNGKTVWQSEGGAVKEHKDDNAPITNNGKEDDGLPF